MLANVIRYAVYESHDHKFTHIEIESEPFKYFVWIFCVEVKVYGDQK